MIRIFLRDTGQKKLWAVEDGRLRLRFHPGQLRAWHSIARFVFMLAGTQGGKTAFGVWWLLNEIKRCGQGDYLAVTASFDLFKLKVLPEIRTVFEHLLGMGRYWANERILELKDPTTDTFWAKNSSDLMWGRIILRSTQSSGGGLEAMTAKAAWLDECGLNEFRLSDWEAVLRRLSLSLGRVLGTTTLYNRGWLKTEVYDRWQAGDEDYDVIQFESISNPAFPFKEYERVLRTMAQWKIRMLYQGLFDNPPGLIYDVFKEAVHRIQAFPIPMEWPVVVGIDPVGASICALGVAFDPHKLQLHVFSEYYEPYGRTTAEHAAAVSQSLYGRRVVKFIGGGPSERQARLDWRAAGIPLEPPSVWAVESGIDRVYGLFKTVKLVVHSSCPHLLAELGTYMRALDDADEVTEKIVDKDSFHCLVGETLVSIQNGQVPIRLVRAGTMVLTRNGYRRVTRQACTNRAAKVYAVVFSNGTIVTGTSEHPFYVQGKGYTELHALQYGDVILTREESECRRQENVVGLLRATSSRRTPVSVHVQRVTKCEQRQPVYNLDVEGEHEYFANGILAHNCLDSLRYAISWLTDPGEVAARILYDPLKIGRY